MLCFCDDQIIISLFSFSSKPDDDALFNLLNKVPIDWTKDFYFSTFHQHLHPVCEKVSQQYGSLHGDIPEHTMVQTSGYTIPDVNLPDGYVADRLTIEEAPIVIGTWKFTGCFSKEAVHHRVEHAILKHSTVAIRDREGSLVAFEIITPHGTKGIIPRSIVTVTAYVLRLVYTIVTQNR